MLRRPKGRMVALLNAIDLAVSLSVSSTALLADCFSLEASADSTLFLLSLLSVLRN